MTPFVRDFCREKHIAIMRGLPTWTAPVYFLPSEERKPISFELIWRPVYLLHESPDYLHFLQFGTAEGNFSKRLLDWKVLFNYLFLKEEHTRLDMEWIELKLQNFVDHKHPQVHPNQKYAETTLQLSEHLLMYQWVARLVFNIFWISLPFEVTRRTAHPANHHFQLEW